MVIGEALLDEAVYQRIVAVAAPEAVGSARLVAVTVTLTRPVDDGAVYNPLCVMVPMAGDMLHETPRFCVPVTLALNCREEPDRTNTLFGETETVTGVGG